MEYLLSPIQNGVAWFTVAPEPPDQPWTECEFPSIMVFMCGSAQQQTTPPIPLLH
jgi:hypothetical protein